jgi:hypothetical protein
VSFIARRRTSTRLRLAPDPSQPGIVETVTLDPAEVDALLAQGKEAIAAG